MAGAEESRKLRVYHDAVHLSNYKTRGGEEPELRRAQAHLLAFDGKARCGALSALRRLASQLHQNTTKTQDMQALRGRP